MSVCIHGNLCRDIFKKTGYIRSASCPKNCKYFEELSQNQKSNPSYEFINGLKNEFEEFINRHIEEG